jgi:hypothetical protein
VNLEQIIKNTIIQKAEPIGFDEFMNGKIIYITIRCFDRFLIIVLDVYQMFSE